jgi:hypothetical protein
LKIGEPTPLRRVRIWCQTSRVVVSFGERCTSHCFKPRRQIRITPGQETHPGFTLDFHPLLAFSRSRWRVTVRERSTEGDQDLFRGSDTQVRRSIRPGDRQASLGSILSNSIDPRLGHHDDPHARSGVRQAPGGKLALRD